MKCNIGQIQQGFSRYVETELLSKASGVQLFGMSFVTGVLYARMSKAANALVNNKALQALEVVDGEGLFDLDLLKDCAMKAMERSGNVVVNIPLMGAVTFSRADIERLADAIQNQ